MANKSRAAKSHALGEETKKKKHHKHHHHHHGSKELTNLANVYYKTNLPLNKHFRHQKCLFMTRIVL